MFCFKKLTAFGYADITLTLDNSILSDDRSILRLSFARFTRRYWEHHSYFLVLPLVICLNSGGSLASREIICVFMHLCVYKITIWSLDVRRSVGIILLVVEEVIITNGHFLTNHWKLFDPTTYTFSYIHDKTVDSSIKDQSFSYAGKHRIDLIVNIKARMPILDKSINQTCRPRDMNKYIDNINLEHQR
jgi:hypothetical protein